MYQLNKIATIAGVSELRTRSSEILNSAKKSDVILQRHSEPVAVILDYKRYLELELLLEKYEDEYYGQLVQKRAKKVSDDNQYIDIEKW